MIRYFVLFVAGILSMAAGCGDNGNSVCLDDRIAEFKKTNADRGATGIYIFELGEETYHIFDNGIAFDAIADVVNSDCEVVCTYGGLSNSSCDLYQEGINRAVSEWEGGQ